MTEKIFTSIYLATLAGAVFVLYKYQFLAEAEIPLKKITTVICTGYVLALSLAFFRFYNDYRALHFVVLLAFCPLLWTILSGGRKYGYDGNLNLLLVALLLGSIGISTQYRMNLYSDGILSRITGLPKFPTALSHFIFTIASFAAVSLLVFSGVMGKIIDLIERRTGLLFWGCISLMLLIIPIAVGHPIGATLSWVFSRSGQPSELTKVSFIIFLAKFFSVRPFDLSNKAHPMKKAFKILAGLGFLTALFFFFPLVFLQKEMGTALMISLTLIIMLTVTSGRWQVLGLGAAAIVLSMTCAVILSDRIEERIVGGYIKWRDYAFTEYFEGSDNWPGNQPFKALSSVNNSGIWGTALCKGRPKMPHVSNDYISVPIMEELGIVGLVILIAAYLLFIREAYSVHIAADFKGLLLVGLPLTILCTAFYNLSGVLEIVAFTGVPLPFVSSGGSSIFCNYLAVGIMTALLCEVRQEHPAAAS